MHVMLPLWPHVDNYHKTDVFLFMFSASGCACWQLFSAMETYVLFTDHIEGLSTCECVCTEERGGVVVTAIQ